jgi:hypothetical protein
MNKLGICEPGEVVSESHLKQYEEFFSKPMSRERVAAVAAFFALSVPDVGEATLCV